MKPPNKFVLFVSNLLLSLYFLVSGDNPEPMETIPSAAEEPNHPSHSYEKYETTKALGGTVWCDRCNKDTESTIMMPKSHFMPLFIICWECRGVKQAGIGYLEEYKPDPSPKGES